MILTFRYAILCTVGRKHMFSSIFTVKTDRPSGSSVWDKTDSEGEIHMKRRNRKRMFLGLGAAGIILLTVLIILAVRHFSADKVDTSEGLAVIKAAEKENVKDIEKKIQKLDAKDSQDESGTVNFKSQFASAVVMGDSITEALTEYDLLNASSVVSQIGVTLDNMEDQVQTVTEIAPQVIFLSYGMNDILSTNGNVDLFIDHYKKLIQELRTALPETTICINSIFPVSEAKSAEEPLFKKISSFNEALQQMCDENQLAFVDNTDIASDVYHEEDGIHFKIDFYPLWLRRMAEVAAL